jgi:Na+:H+ antiporter, NhaC family
MRTQQPIRPEHTSLPSPAEDSMLPRVQTPDGTQPGLGFSLTALGTIVAVLAIGLLRFDAPLPLMMVIGFGVALAFAAMRKVSYENAENAAFDMVRRGLQPLLIFVAVGALIASWIYSGTVPTMIYYGLELISPAWFLPTALILCAITSFINGTNFATVATIGLALMGVATALGIPLGVAAGAIICGALFGDKMSPLSDTTVMAPGLAGAELFAHIRHMMWTTVPAIVISLAIFTVMGFNYAIDADGLARVQTASQGLTSAFNVGLIPLLPPLLVFVLLLLKVDAFPAIGLGALAGVPVAVYYQGAALTDVLLALWEGYIAPESLGEVAGLLSGGESGGVLKLIGLAAIVIFALAMTGALSAAGVMQTVLDSLGRKLNTARKLVPATLGITVALNAIGGAVNFAVAMGTSTLRPLFAREGVAAKNLSRATEDAANTTGVFIPWNATAVFTAASLGVSVSAYAPWVFFAFITPLISLVYGLTGFTITRGPGVESADPRVDAAT